MAIIKFPPVEEAVDGLLAIGGELGPSSLIEAYKRGIFPWPFTESDPIAWFSPDPRGVLDWKSLHLPRSLKRFLKKCDLTLKYNEDFDSIIVKCAEIPRKNQSSTWITSSMLEAYRELFKRGLAYCIGSYWEENLVGGIYGVCIEGIVSGESMFYERPNAGKVCLISLMEKLHLAGIDWLDTQMVTPVVQSLGGREISRREFLERLSSCRPLSREEIFGPHWNHYLNL